MVKLQLPKLIRGRFDSVIRSMQAPTTQIAFRGFFFVRISVIMCEVIFLSVIRQFMAAKNCKVYRLFFSFGNENIFMFEFKII